MAEPFDKPFGIELRAEMLRTFAILSFVLY
jgi:hypothetical protein